MGWVTNLPIGGGGWQKKLLLENGFHFQVSVKTDQTKMSVGPFLPLSLCKKAKYYHTSLDLQGPDKCLLFKIGVFFFSVRQSLTYGN